MGIEVAHLPALAMRRIADLEKGLGTAADDVAVDLS